MQIFAGFRFHRSILLVEGSRSSFVTVAVVSAKSNGFF